MMHLWLDGDPAWNQSVSHDQNNQASCLNKKGNWRATGSLPDKYWLNVWYMGYKGFFVVTMCQCQRHPFAKREPLSWSRLLNHTPTPGGHRFYTIWPLHQPRYVTSIRFSSSVLQFLAIPMCQRISDWPLPSQVVHAPKYVNSLNPSSWLDQTWTTFETE